VCLNLSMCVRSTYVYIFARQWGEILDQLLFFLKHVILPKCRGEKCERDTENSNPHGFELHRPSIRGTQLLFEVIKATIIMCEWFTSWLDIIQVRPKFTKAGDSENLVEPSRMN